MVSIVIPVYNAAAFLPLLLHKLQEQTLSSEIIFIDSESNDSTQKILAQEKVFTTRIKKADFNHGGTRNLGLQLASHETVVFLTQDALPASPLSIQHLVNMLYKEDSIAMAYGRQLPYPGTGVLGRFARLANYPAQSIIKNEALIPQLGIKTCSCSNSFAAYRKTDLLAIGGFPINTILGEDVSVGARFILQGKAIAYCAEAEVFHSHDYTLLEEFKRYFDIGVFHEEQQEVLKYFSRAETQGLRFMLDEWNYLIQNGEVGLIPSQVIRSIAKYLGYKLGRQEKKIPKRIKQSFSMHQSFWQQ